MYLDKRFESIMHCAVGQKLARCLSLGLHLATITGALPALTGGVTVNRVQVLSTAAAWLALAASIRADVIICTPWARVQVGQANVSVQAPYVNLNIPRRTAAPIAPAMPLPPAHNVPAVIPGEPPPPPQPRGAVVPTPAEFARSLVPQAGRHEAVILHPATGQPVSISFTLPPGQPRHVRVRHWRVVLDYGRHNVAIVFLRNGGVRVRD